MNTNTPEIAILRAKLQALKSLSEELLVALQTDLEALDNAQVSQLMTRRQALIAELAEVPASERQAFKVQEPQLVASVAALGEQCMAAVQAHSRQHNAQQQQMNQGRHLLQAYQPQESQSAHYIEDDA